MIKTFDITEFGKHLREIREMKKWTQKDIAKEINVSLKTYGDIELGHSDPKLSVISALAHVFGGTIWDGLKRYCNSYQVTSILEKTEELIISGDSKAIRETLADFPAFKKANKLINPLELKQFNLFLKAMIERYHNTGENYGKAIKYCEKALRLKHPKFNIYSLERHGFSIFELRILFLLGACYSMLDQFEASLSISQFVLTSLDQSKNASQSEKLLVLKSYTTISYDFHMVDDVEKSFSFAQSGIDFCNTNSLSFLLPSLLMRKAVALYRMDDIEKSHDIMEMALTLFKIQEQFNAYDQYLEIVQRKYDYAKGA